jgi:hypothetical protein
MEVLWNWILVPSRRRVQLRRTCLDVLVRYVIDAPVIWCPRNGPSTQFRPCRTHRGFCIHLEFIVLSCLWPAGGTRCFLVRQAYRLYVVSGQYSADSVEYRPNIEQKGDWAWLIIRFTDIRTTAEDIVNLTVVVTVLSENASQEHQLRMQVVFFFRSRSVLPWRWRRRFPPKRRFLQDPHGATSQKMVVYVVTAVLHVYLPVLYCV